MENEVRRETCESVGAINRPSMVLLFDKVRDTKGQGKSECFPIAYSAQHEHAIGIGSILVSLSPPICHSGL